MGGWFLEVAKMGLYLTFPVATFHYFHKPEYFERWVIQKKREMYPPEDEMYREQVHALFRDMNNGNLNEKIKLFDQMEKEKKNLEEEKERN